jgi:hypothetical protein
MDRCCSKQDVRLTQYGEWTATFETRVAEDGSFETAGTPLWDDRVTLQSEWVCSACGASHSQDGKVWWR